MSNIEFYVPPLFPEVDFEHFSEASSVQHSPPPQQEIKRRKISGSRQPQKRYSTGNSNAAEAFFDSKNPNNGGVPLTTNRPREVGVFSKAGVRLHLFPSCSEASRAMDINRSKISRTCRQGGGEIENLMYKYVEAEQDQQSPEEPHVPQLFSSAPFTDEDLHYLPSALPPPLHLPTVSADIHDVPL